MRHIDPEEHARQSFARLVRYNAVVAGVVTVASFAIIVWWQVTRTAPDALRADHGSAGGAGGARRTPVDPRAAAADRELQGILDEIARAWKPSARQRVFDKAKAIHERLRGPLLRALSRTDARRFQEAVLLAGELKDPPMRRFVIDHAISGPASVRKLALRVANDIAPLKGAEVDRLLRASDPAVVVAMLQTLARREVVPVEKVLTAFHHPNPLVRAAAVAAVPPGIDRDILKFLAHEGASQTVLAAIQALGRAGVDDDVEPFLIGFLGDPSTRTAALRSLAQKSSPLVRAEAVWQIVLDAKLSLDERAMGLACLEQTASMSTIEIGTDAHYLPGFLRYRAARALVRVGHRDGVAMLLDLLEEGTDAFARLSREQAQATIDEIRHLLAVLSRSQRDAGLSTWRAWFDRLQRVPRPELPSCRVRPGR